MVCKEINFNDALDGQRVSAAVQSVSEPDLQGNEDVNQSVFVGLIGESGYSASSAYMPRQQVQEFIDALKEALNEE